jgi:serralysin
MSYNWTANSQSFMKYDVAALQQLYGADYTTNASNSTNRWSPLTGEMSINGVGQGAPSVNKILSTVWDGGGVDTYDFSNNKRRRQDYLTPVRGTPLQTVSLGMAQIAISPTPSSTKAMLGP